jgi:DNA-binding CsgD family transcriptional regulator
MARRGAIRMTLTEVAGHDLLRLELRPEGHLPRCLTAAESEIACLLLSGLSDREIARQRRTTARTVANQLQAIYVKLGMGNRAELVAHLAQRLVERRDG